MGVGFGVGLGVGLGVGVGVGVGGAATTIVRVLLGAELRTVPAQVVSVEEKS